MAQFVGYEPFEPYVARRGVKHGTAEVCRLEPDDNEPGTVSSR